MNFDFEHPDVGSSEPYLEAERIFQYLSRYLVGNQHIQNTLVCCQKSEL
jgi:hypothetical protein